MEFKILKDSIKPFQEMERDKVSHYIYYTFYGIRGVRFILIPNPISVLFNDLGIFGSMDANVDTGEGLHIYNSYKGKDIFDESGGYMDFSGLAMLVGSFIGILYGWLGTHNRNYLKFLGDLSASDKIFFPIILARIFLLNLAILVLFGLSFLWLLLWGIDVINAYYFFFMLELLIVVTIFVLIGALCGFIKEKAKRYATPAVIFFLLLLLIPWLIQKVIYIETTKSMKPIYEFEYETFKVIMTFEKRLYERFGVFKSGSVAPREIQDAIMKCFNIEYKDLREYEEKRLASIYKRIKAYQAISAFFPTTFYLSVNKEISSKGFQSFIAFYQYAFKMKYDFISFYIQKKFFNPYPKEGVEPFIKGNENIFNSQSSLPLTFWWGNGLMLLYITALLIILYRMEYKTGGTETTTKPDVDFSRGNPLFALCKDEKVKDEIFRHYQQRKDVVNIDRIAVDFQFTGIPGHRVVAFLCKLAQTNEKKAMEYLNILGVQDFNEQKLSYEEILKCYAAVKMSKPAAEYIVLNDFFKKESRAFEKDLFKLLAFLKASGKKILYLSCAMYYPKITPEQNIALESYCLFPLPIDQVTLR